MRESTGSSYGWVVVAVGALMTCVAFGSMLSLAVFLQPISQDMGWSRSGVSAAVTIDFLAMGLAAFFWGALSDRYGTRIVVLSGSLLLGAGLIGASQATSLWQFQFFFGVLIGIAAGSFYAPMVAGRERLDRAPAQPCGCAGVGRHGGVAAHGRPVRELADHDL
jgi:MFS family permease